MIQYATLDEIKAANPDAFGSVTDYDDILRKMAIRASRLIDRLARRGPQAFAEQVATRYYDGDGERDLWIDALLSVTSIGISSDDGSNYSTLTSSDYLLLGGQSDRYDGTPYYCIRLDKNGTYSQWWTGQQTAKVIGLWGWHDDYGNAWEDSQDTVEDDPFAAGATSITVNDADGNDVWGASDRFQVGQLLQIESEQFLVTARNTTTNVLTVQGAQNGTTAAEHVQNTTINVWRPAECVKQAVIVQAMRWFKRGQQSWQDTVASAEMGQLMYFKELDPDVRTMLLTSGIRKNVV